MYRRSDSIRGNGPGIVEMTCGHKTPNFDCKNCRSKVKVFDTETEFQLHKLLGVCNKLEKVLEWRISEKVYNVILSSIEEIEDSCTLIKKEIGHEDINTGDLWSAGGRGGVSSHK
jgi:hypothetical protein